MWECGEEQTHRQTHKRTAVATVHFASAMPHNVDVDDVVEFYISHIISIPRGNTIDIGLPIRPLGGFGQSNFDMGWLGPASGGLTARLGCEKLIHIHL